MEEVAPPLGLYSAVVSLDGTPVTVTNRVEVRLKKLVQVSPLPRRSTRPSTRSQREKCAVSGLDREEIYWNT